MVFKEAINEFLKHGLLSIFLMGLLFYYHEHREWVWALTICVGVIITGIQELLVTYEMLPEKEE